MRPGRTSRALSVDAAGCSPRAILTHDLPLGEAGELLDVEQLVTHPRVERLDVRVLPPRALGSMYTVPAFENSHQVRSAPAHGLTAAHRRDLASTHCREGSPGRRSLLGRCSFQPLQAHRAAWLGSRRVGNRVDPSSSSLTCLRIQPALCRGCESGLAPAENPFRLHLQAATRGRAPSLRRQRRRPGLQAAPVVRKRAETTADFSFWRRRWLMHSTACGRPTAGRRAYAFVVSEPAPRADPVRRSHQLRVAPQAASEPVAQAGVPVRA